ncbi:MAG: antitoxin VapB family protein [Promethearchaeota archaeon]
MASKTISVTEETYNLLSKFKLPHESFGDVIKKLCAEKSAKNLIDWVNSQPIWSNMSEEEINNIKRSSR